VQVGVVQVGVVQVGVVQVGVVQVGVVQVDGRRKFMDGLTRECADSFLGSILVLVEFSITRDRRVPCQQ